MAIPTERELAGMAVLRQMRFGPWPVLAPAAVWKLLEKRGRVRAVTLEGATSYLITGAGSDHLDRAALEEAERERDGSGSEAPRKASARR